MSRHVIALIDCSSFYVSVERSFNTALQGRPVIVLSNNDGNIVAASAEAKKLGLRRGSPYFQCRALIRRHRVAVYSSNYALYQDVSDRVMQVVAEFAEQRGGVRQQEIYSIDECFISLAHVASERLTAVAREIRAKVMQATGIPARVGVGSTKILAKIAAEMARREPAYEDVFNLVDVPEQVIDAILETFAVEELWGIGKRLASRLADEYIFTADVLKYVSRRLIRKTLGVVGERIVLELHGIACLPLELQPGPKKGMLVSRSFGQVIESREKLADALSHFAARAAEKLRKQGSVAATMSIYVSTNAFDIQADQYEQKASKRLMFPTDFTPDLIEAARLLLEEIYRPGFKYKRAGVYLSDIRPNDVQQPDLFAEYSLGRAIKKAALMAVVDLINTLWGKRDVLFFAAQGTDREWEAKPLQLSQRYTTKWSELMTVT
jgi:DNA polymerase V